jgi:fructan beta-fructosidase
MRAVFIPGDATVSFNVRGVPIVYDAKKQEIAVGNVRAPAPLRDGRQSLIVYADRTVIEVFASGGLTYVPLPINLKPDETSVSVSVTAGAVQFKKLEANTLKSAWRK